MKFIGLLVLMLCNACHSHRPPNTPIVKPKEKPTLVAPPPGYGNKIV